MYNNNRFLNFKTLILKHLLSNKNEFENITALFKVDLKCCTLQSKSLNNLLHS